MHCNFTREDSLYIEICVTNQQQHAHNEKTRSSAQAVCVQYSVRHEARGVSRSQQDALVVLAV